MDFHFDAVIEHAEVFEEIEGGDAGGVFCGVFGEFSFVAGDFGNLQAGVIGVADDDFVSGGVDGKAEDVVTAGNVRDGGGCEDADFMVRWHRRELGGLGVGVLCRFCWKDKI